MTSVRKVIKAEKRHARRFVVACVPNDGLLESLCKIFYLSTGIAFGLKSPSVIRAEAWRKQFLTREKRKIRKQGN